MNFRDSVGPTCQLFFFLARAHAPHDLRRQPLMHTPSSLMFSLLAVQGSRRTWAAPLDTPLAISAIRIFLSAVQLRLLLTVH